MSARTRELSADSQGRFRPRIGWTRQIPSGKRYQPRFNLGRDKAEALVRVEKIRRMYDECSPYNNGPDVLPGERGLWLRVSLVLAEQVAEGRQTVELPTFKLVIYKVGGEIIDTSDMEDTEDDDEIMRYARQLESARRRHPWLTITPANPELHNTALRLGQQYVATKLSELRCELMRDKVPLVKGELPDRLITGTLHAALDAYSLSIRKTGTTLAGSDKLVPYQRKRLDQVARLKRVHPDTPLYLLNYDWCAEAISAWRNRPATQKGGPCSPKDAKNHLGQLMRFFEWLDHTTQFGWTQPKGIERLDRRIKALASDRRDSIITVETYSPAQLIAINRHASPLERLCLYLGLNCAMGAAELGRLEVDDFTFTTPHPQAERFEFATTDSDSFLKHHRPKTGVYGEWLLWPEVAAMARWGIERAGRIGSRILFVRENGQPIYRETLQNQQAGFANLWNRLLDRVQKSHSDFPRLPFGSLRDTLPDLLRQKYGDEIASLCLAHGSPSKKDRLLDDYANKPFGRLFNAIRELHTRYAPVFTIVSDPFHDAKHYLSVEMKCKVRDLLAASKSIAEIVRECKVSRSTVARERATVVKQSRRCCDEDPLVMAALTDEQPAQPLTGSAGLHRHRRSSE